MSPPIPFTKPRVGARELGYVKRVLTESDLASEGRFTVACSELLQERLGIPRVLLTTSCTSALEAAAMLCDLEPGDEVIMPSFTFVSTANAVVRQGARPVFVDVRLQDLNLDESLVEEAITPRTRAIFPVHYAGVGCEMDALLDIAARHHLRVVEDAAQGVHARYRGRALGSMGDLGAFSFHQTKNFVCGEGGALCVNDEALVERAEIVREKGTNRQQFLRGQVDKYTWVDVGSSFVISEILSAVLLAQLEQAEELTAARRAVHEAYDRALEPLEAAGLLRRPRVPADRETNYHLYHVLVRDQETRDGLLTRLRARGIQAAFHYVPLHDSPMGRKLAGQPRRLPVTEDASRRLLRLPLHADLTEEEISRVAEALAHGLRGQR
jgi:dTDP-4-amino-4,6-dideoxygalactose transaminase